MKSRVAHFRFAVFLILGTLIAISLQGICQDDSMGNETASAAASTEHTGRYQGSSIFNPGSASFFQDDSMSNATGSVASSTGHTGNANSGSSGQGAAGVNQDDSQPDIRGRAEISTRHTGISSQDSEKGASSGYQGSNPDNANTIGNNMGTNNVGTNNAGTNNGGNSGQYGSKEGASGFSGSGSMNGEQSSGQSGLAGASGGFGGPNERGGNDLHSSVPPTSSNGGSNRLWIQGMNGGCIITCPVGTSLNLEADVPSGGIGDLLDVTIRSGNSQAARYRFVPGYNALTFTPGQADRHILLFIINNQPSNVLIVDTIDAYSREAGYSVSRPPMQSSYPDGSETYREPVQLPKHLPGGRDAVTYSEPEMTDDYLGS